MTALLAHTENKGRTSLRGERTSVQYPLRMPPDVARRLEDRAKESGASKNELIVRALETSIERATTPPEGVISELTSIKSLLENISVVGRAEPKNEVESARRLLLMEVSCGLGLEMHEMTECIGEPSSYQFEGALARKATMNSFVARARGCSMQNSEYPESISPGDLILLTPFDEYTDVVECGTIILARLEMQDGTRRYTLKEYTGKRLKANNPEFKDVEFGPEVRRASVYAVCRGVLERVFK